MPHLQCSRRQFLLAAGASTGLLAPAAWADDTPRSRPPARNGKPSKKIAVVTTAYHYLSHAYHICGRFLHGYLRDGRPHFVDYAVAGMYVDQPKHPGDLSRDLSKEFGFTLYDTVAGALTLGGDRLAVDGVLLIG